MHFSKTDNGICHLIRPLQTAAFIINWANYKLASKLIQASPSRGITKLRDKLGATANGVIKEYVWRRRETRREVKVKFRYTCIFLN